MRGTMKDTTFIAHQGPVRGGPPIGALAFFRDRGIMPWLIRFWTRRGAPAWEPGGFNHVAICIGLDRWLSAEPQGVKERTLSYLSRHSEVVIILSFAGPPRVAFIAAQEACKAANGKRYDFLGCMGFILNRIAGFTISSRANWFCSELCSYAWMEAMAHAGVPHEYRDPADTTPNDLARWALANGFTRYQPSITSN